MASEKENFKKAIGYIKYEFDKTNDDTQREFLKKELLYWADKWRFKAEEIETIPSATKESIISDFDKDFKLSKYKRLDSVANLLDNDFDKLLTNHI